jgi:hypothetical protein
MKEMFKPLLEWHLNSLKADGDSLVALTMAVQGSAHHAANKDRNIQGQTARTVACAAIAPAM